jgi:hypothetical protein
MTVAMARPIGARADSLGSWLWVAIFEGTPARSDRHAALSHARPRRAMRIFWVAESRLDSIK